MKDMGIVHGGPIAAQPLIIGKTQVLVHTDITPIEVDDDNGNKHTEYSYHEYKYDKDEYIYVIANKQQSQIDYIAMMSDIDIDE